MQVRLFSSPAKTCRKVTSCNICPSIASDHEIVTVKIRISSIIRGPGLWKFNNSLLEDNNFKEDVRSYIDEVWGNNTEIEDLRVRWDYLKYEIMLKSKQYARIKAKK